MKLTTTRPILMGKDVLVEGQEFDTTEQHGRELVARGYAQPGDEAGDDKESAKKPGRKPKDEK
ncbi:hypothetical protein [Melaminivora sp.]|uniref:hypothetical protein n=1 Tax=Melaminivora sp. TaxID=1933032 RepID=UPI0028A7C378|nr:hypothetical protein [Melaminivora sp.]